MIPARLRDPPLLVQFLRYGLASGVALGVDWGLRVGLTETLGVPYLAAAAAGFFAGMLVAYALSVRFVFEERRYADPRAELALFAGIGVVTLALNQALLFALVEALGVHYAVAKAPTAGACFLANFALRKALLFSSRRACPVTG